MISVPSVSRECLSCCVLHGKSGQVWLNLPGGFPWLGALHAPRAQLCKNGEGVFSSQCVCKPELVMPIRMELVPVGPVGCHG